MALNMLDQNNLTYIYRIFHLKATEYISFSMEHSPGQIIFQTTSLSKFKKTEIISSILSTTMVWNPKSIARRKVKDSHIYGDQSRSYWTINGLNKKLKEKFHLYLGTNENQNTTLPKLRGYSESSSKREIYS